MIENKKEKIHVRFLFLPLGKYVAISGLDIPSANEYNNDMHNNIVKVNKNNDHTLVSSHLMFLQSNMSDGAKEKEDKKRREEKKEKERLCESVCGFFSNFSIFKENR